MILIRYIFLVIFSLLLKYIVAFPLTPIIVLFSSNDGYLPKWLKWFETPDNPIDGDSGWRTESRPFLNESNRFKRYVNRCFWLWRNSLYGFNESVLSLRCNGSEDMIKLGTPNVSNGTKGAPGKNGFARWYLYRNKKLIGFQWYIIYQWPFKKEKCLRILLGYKLFQWKKNENSKCHLAFSPWVYNKFYN